MKAKKIFNRISPVAFFLAVTVTLFLPFFRRGLLPIPADIITGVYYPWLDYKWGYSTGVPVKNPMISDVPSIIYPWRSFAIDELKNFRWPLWNPYYFAGMPLLANFQSAVFSHANVFFLFLPKALAWSAGVITSPFLTMLAVYLFLRNKKLSKLSSVFGAVIFGLSGFEIAWLEYNVLSHTALFLPILLFIIDKMFENENKLWSLLLPILVAFQIFSGYLPIVIYSYLICFFYILFFYFLPDLIKHRISIKKYFVFVLFFLWGILISSIQLFPGHELIKNSIRLVDPVVEESKISYLPLQNLSTFFAPDFFGNPSTYNYFGLGFYDNFYLFIGTGTMLMVFYSLLFFKKNKSIVFWLFIFLFSMVLSLQNPIGEKLTKLFFLSGGAASKALFMTDFSLSVLAAFGLDYFLKESGRIKRKMLGVIGLVGLLFLILFSATFSIQNNINRMTALRNLLIPLLIYFICSLVIMLDLLKSKLKIKFANLSSLLLIFIISIQLLYSAKKYLPFTPQNLLFPNTPVLTFLQEKQKTDEPFRVEIGDIVPQNFLMPYGLSTLSGYDTLLLKRTGEFISILENGKKENKIPRIWLIKNYDSPLYPLLNVKYILAKKNNEKEKSIALEKLSVFIQNPRYKLMFEDGSVQIYEDRNILPRAFLVHDYEIAIFFDDYLKKFYSGIDFSQKIILEKEPKLLKPKVKAKIDKITWIKAGSTEMIFNIESDQPGLVFLSNNYFPGWYAYINGVQTEIYRANYTFQAIAVKKGAYEIKFLYNPLSFRLGRLVSLFSILILALFGIRQFIRFKIAPFKN